MSLVEAARYFIALSRSGLSAFLRQALGDVTLADVAARWARKYPERLALEVAGQRRSYAELDRGAQRAAAWLGQLGAGSGSCVALVGKSSVAYVELLLGAARSGITLALVHPELAGVPLRQALEAAGPSFVVCESELLEKLCASTSLRVSTFELAGITNGAAAEPGLGRFAPDRAQRDFALVYTSGTTGLPKACRLPHSRVLSAACLFGAPLFDFRASDKLLCALPLHHGSPLMLGLGACLVAGVPIVLERRFSVSEFWGVARQTGATSLLYVGELGRMLLSAPPAPDDRRHQLRVAVGNGMSADVWSALRARFGIAEVREFYAATESPAGIFNLAGRVGSVGNLPYAWMFGLKLARLDDETDTLVRDARGRIVECAADEPGELLVRARKSGLGVYHGYVDANATEARLVRSALREGDVYFRTGDLLRRDRDGFYYFVERRGESYRFRGENVSAAQVERELLALPGVLQALVVGITLKGYEGGLGLAALVVRPGFDVGSLCGLAKSLPRAALPRFVRFLPELELTGSLKPKRRGLAEAGVDPGRHAEPLWVLHEGAYRRLDAEMYRALERGELRL